LSEKDEKTRVTVKIYGEEYVLRGYADAGYIERLAAYVDKKMRLIVQGNPHLSSYKVAVLVALNITEEMSKLQDDFNSINDQLDDLRAMK
jgi:cell division protein ZapA